MSERLTNIAQNVRTLFTALDKGLSYHYIGHGDAIQNALNEVYQVSGFGEEHRITIQVIDHTDFCALQFLVPDYFFGPDFLEIPFFKQFRLDLLNVRNTTTLAMKAHKI